MWLQELRKEDFQQIWKMKKARYGSTEKVDSVLEC